MSGSIYKLVGGGLTYYGSTKSSLGTRKSKHKNDYKNFLLGKKCYISAYDILEKGDFNIELVEIVEDLDNLQIREGFYIKNNECVNKYVAGRTKQEYYEDNEEKMKAYKAQWAKDNIEKIKQKYQENNIAINEKRRAHMASEEIKTKKKEQDAKYRRENANKIKATKNAKVHCPTCNIEYSKGYMKKHIKTH